MWVCWGSWAGAAGDPIPSVIMRQPQACWLGDYRDTTPVQARLTRSVDAARRPLIARPRPDGGVETLDTNGRPGAARRPEVGGHQTFLQRSHFADPYMSAKQATPPPRCCLYGAMTVVATWTTRWGVVQGPTRTFGPSSCDL